MTLSEIFMTVAIFLSALLALLCGWKKSKAIKANDKPAAAQFETFERVLTALLLAFMIGFILMCNQSVMANGFAKILAELEAMKNG